ncbi:MAG: outer membrane beta-barrel protein [Thermodesulfobacteriota bacterium]
MKKNFSLIIMPNPLRLLLAILLLLPSFAFSEVKDLFLNFQPYISIEEEYNDNINLTARNRIDDFITTISPGIRFSTLPRSSVTGAFPQTPTAEEKFGMIFDVRAGFVIYAREEDYNYVSLNGLLNGWYAPIKNLTFRVRDYLIRSNEIRETDYSVTAVEGQRLLSRTLRRVLYVRNVFEPSMEYRFGRENLFLINFRNNIYEIQSRTAEDSMENTVNPRLSYWFNIRNGMFLEYALTFGDFERSADWVGHLVTGRFIHRFTPKTSIFGEYTYLYRNFDPPSIDYEVHRPSLGLEHAFSSTLSMRAQAGYFRQNPDRGSTKGGLYYDVLMTERAERTTYTVSFHGGYVEEYFTAENLGFTKSHRLIGTISHRLLERMTVGLRGSYERAKYTDGAIDRIWGAGINSSYQVLRWLGLSLEFSHRENHSNISERDYSEYRGIFRITASY